MARRILDNRLYNTLQAIPAQMIIMYSFVISKISSGVFITRSRLSMLAILTAVITIVTITDRMAALPILLRIPSRSPAPKRCAVSTVNPVVSPCVNPKIRKLTDPVAPTAANASTPTNRPTITVSTMLYSCWKILPMIIGMINFVISLEGLPFVISSSINLFSRKNRAPEGPVSHTYTLMLASSITVSRQYPRSLRNRYPACSQFCASIWLLPTPSK